MKKYVKIHVMLFKHWELLLKTLYQTTPIYLWAQSDFFLHCFLSLLFSLLNQTRENSTFFSIFLSSFSIIFIFITTKRCLKGKLINACHANTFFFHKKSAIVKMVNYEYEYQLCPLLTINHFNNCEFCYEKKLCRVALVHYW